MEKLENLKKEIEENEKKIEEASLLEERHNETLGLLKGLNETFVKLWEKGLTFVNQKDFPNEIKVNNLDEIKIPEVKIPDFPEIPKFPNEIGLKEPKWFSFKGVIEAIKDLKKTIINKKEIDPALFTKKQNAIAVKLVTQDGAKFYNAGGGGNSPGGFGSQDSTNLQAIRTNTGTTYHAGLELAKGSIPGHSTVNKFGAALNGVQLTQTDIWSRADSVPTQQIWVAPTQARQHAIVSSSDLDGKTASPNSVGARTIRVYGLTSWATAETSEIITLDGTTAVNTVNSYVIIHRMKVLTSGTQNINVGTIKATALTDNTITAVILTGDGQTEMAIYGVPSTQTAYCMRWYAGIDRTAQTVAVDFELRVNENPNVQLKNFLRKDDISLITTGTSVFDRTYAVPNKFSGPCIIKVQATATVADTDGEAGFDLVLVNN